MKLGSCKKEKLLSFYIPVARMAELVDALDSKSSFRKEVRVRPPLRVPFFFYGNHTQRTGVRYARPAGYN